MTPCVGEAVMRMAPEMKRPGLPRRDFSLLASAAALTAMGCSRETRAAIGQSARHDLYQCEGCDGAMERDAAMLAAFARIADANEPGEALLIEGTVFAVDGVTPAQGVVIYAYQTNAAGLYANGTPETQWSQRHGRLRGWVRTDAAGRYSFLTIKPAPYPNDVLPAHVHFTVLEPGRRPYWIDDIVFDGEFGVTPAYRAARENRGGDGIVRLARTTDGAWLARRDIVLERHPT
jgi:protocatechuate 3,4-dioxygenase, beta subunit